MSDPRDWLDRMSPEELDKFMMDLITMPKKYDMDPIQVANVATLMQVAVEASRRK